MNRRGITLIEMMIGVAMLGIIASVIAGLFGAAEKSFVYASGQTAMLSGIRKGLEGGGVPHGVIWEARQATTVRSLSASALSLTTPDGSAPQFSLSGTNLQTVQSSITRTVAQKVTGLELAYYNLDSAGHIITAASAGAASFVAAQVQVQGSSAKTYTFYTGARLRNHT
jgi:prepilin-type N-terminal cleavage/methylation domain-containing protein